MKLAISIDTVAIHLHRFGSVSKRLLIKLANMIPPMYVERSRYDDDDDMMSF